MQRRHCARELHQLGQIDAPPCVRPRCLGLGPQSGLPPASATSSCWMRPSFQAKGSARRALSATTGSARNAAASPPLAQAPLGDQIMVVLDGSSVKNRVEAQTQGQLFFPCSDCSASFLAARTLRARAPPAWPGARCRAYGLGVSASARRAGFLPPCLHALSLYASFAPRKRLRAPRAEC